MHTYSLSIMCTFVGHGPCDPVTGACHCDDVTTGRYCDTCKPGYFGNPTNGGPCYAYCAPGLTRVELTAQSGYLSSGPTTLCDPPNIYSKQCYPLSHACAFTILTNDSRATISLTFDSFATECSFDFLHVFDGLGFNNTLLGAFSGTSRPPVLYARSGAMTLNFYSDAGFALSGFKARYSIDVCPGSCSFHGVCASNGTCICDAGFIGAHCEMERCPNNCSSSSGQGVCSKSLGHCVCNNDYGGRDCSVPPNTGIRCFHDGFIVKWTE